MQQTQRDSEAPDSHRSDCERLSLQRERQFHHARRDSKWGWKRPFLVRAENWSALWSALAKRSKTGKINVTVETLCVGSNPFSIRASEPDDEMLCLRAAEAAEKRKEATDGTDLSNIQKKRGSKTSFTQVWLKNSPFQLSPLLDTIKIPKVLLVKRVGSGERIRS